MNCNIFFQIQIREYRIKILNKLKGQLFDFQLKKNQFFLIEKSKRPVVKNWKIAQNNIQLRIALTVQGILNRTYTWTLTKIIGYKTCSHIIFILVYTNRNQSLRATFINSKIKS